jgi:NTE family protein
LAHIGVIRALDEAGIKIHCIAGTSIGALIGAVHAAGRLDELEAFFQGLGWRRMAPFFDVVFPKSGLIDGAKVEALVRSHVHPNAIEALRIPFCAVATDLLIGEEIAISQGDVIEAVRASISVPGIFTPHRHEGRTLVDGGLTNPVPISVARAMGADIVIAVDLNHGIVAKRASEHLRSDRTDAPPSTQRTNVRRQSRRALKARLFAHNATGRQRFPRRSSPREPLPNIFEVLLASVSIMEARITQSRLEADRPEILIQPPLEHIRFLDFGRAKEIMGIGHAAARESIKAGQGIFRET